MKKFLGNLALDATIAVVMGSLSAIARCMELHDDVKQGLSRRPKRRRF